MHNKTKSDDRNLLKKSKKIEGIFGLSFVLVIQIILMVAILTSLFYSATKTTNYVVLSQQGMNEFRALIKLNQPNHKTSIVANWVSDALVSTFDFNYINMTEHLTEESTNWFTGAGRTALINALEANEYFAEVIEKKAIVQLQTTQNPVFIKSRLNEETGRYEWIFQVPVMFTYVISERKPEVSNAIFTLSVERVPFSDNDKGLGINKLIISR
ncbi:DotI/IcmL family type IV secretion protein [Pseudoalteromonas sp. OFAV1]|uniref:DotI/IcmL family type IV secretion protein n=1 Tax=Pseudoalteromonas sp. OFAV1 TaxID=2908892 RepID=UPI001F3F351C|nr:DotI/IcmL family type IV secretion protein [Pseudoalteromonas sp. OFAV1]MCF2901198.1 DotI/IcmL family type IV secretion protein [Pseudoalteromonas sp. OFAV1]